MKQSDVLKAFTPQPTDHYNSNATYLCDLCRHTVDLDKANRWVTVTGGSALCEDRTTTGKFAGYVSHRVSRVKI